MLESRSGQTNAENAGLCHILLFDAGNAVRLGRTKSEATIWTASTLAIGFRASMQADGQEEFVGTDCYLIHCVEPGTKCPSVKWIRPWITGSVGRMSYIQKAWDNFGHLLYAEDLNQSRTDRPHPSVWKSMLQRLYERLRRRFT